MAGNETTIGASRPLPTHIGSRISHAGTRRPQRWVSASTTTIAAISRAAVKALAIRITGAVIKPASGTPISTPAIQKSFRNRYGSMPTTAT